MDSKVLHYVGMIVVLEVEEVNAICGHCQVKGRVLMKENQTPS